MSTIRTFLAVNLSVPSIRAATEVERALAAGVPGGLRVAWVPPANLHLTIKFLGNVRPEAVEAVADALRPGLAAQTPFEVHARGAGAFPTAASPRVIWLGLEDPAGGLTALQALVENRTADLGFPREERPFSPHLTLGRVKEGRISLAELLERHRDADCGVSTIRELVLYESRLRAEGAEYRALSRLPFGGKATAPPSPPPAASPPVESRGKENDHGD